MGCARGTDVTAVQNEPMVRIGPEFSGDCAQQPLLHLQRRAARRESGPIGDPEDMRIHCDGRFSEGGIQHHIRSLSADARQALQRRTLARDLPCVFPHQYPARPK